jgi:hypothetical protein
VEDLTALSSASSGNLKGLTKTELAGLVRRTETRDEARRLVNLATDPTSSRTSLLDEAAARSEIAEVVGDHR